MKPIRVNKRFYVYVIYDPLIVGTGYAPTRERHEPEFEIERRLIAPYLQVNDC